MIQKARWIVLPLDCAAYWVRINRQVCLLKILRLRSVLFGENGKGLCLLQIS